MSEPLQGIKTVYPLWGISNPAPCAFCGAIDETCDDFPECPNAPEGDGTVIREENDL